MPTNKEMSDVTTEQTFLTGEFFLYPKTKNKYHISVTSARMLWSQEKGKGDCGPDSLMFADIIGCDCLKGKSANDANAYLTVYAYPHRRKFASKKTLRQRQILTVAFESRNSFEENCKEANKWKLLIMSLVRDIHVEFAGTRSMFIKANCVGLFVTSLPAH